MIYYLYSIFRFVLHDNLINQEVTIYVKYVRKCALLHYLKYIKNPYGIQSDFQKQRVQQKSEVLL